MSVSKRFEPLRTVAGLAVAVLLLSSTAPAVAADEPIHYLADFAIVSTTIDKETAIPTITYTFRCLEPIEFLRLRSQLDQVHAGKSAGSYQESFEAPCQAGTTVTFAVAYGLQGNRFYVGRADLSAWLEAYIGTFTVDSLTIMATVRLSPAHRDH
jgi:hypothetical protein